MAESLSARAVRELRRSAGRLIAEDGILDENAVLGHVTDLMERRHGPRLRMTGPLWKQTCRYIEHSYTLGLLVGARFVDLQFLVAHRRRRARRKKKGGAR
jgi:hypothetical protein